MRCCLNILILSLFVLYGNVHSQERKELVDKPDLEEIEANLAIIDETVDLDELKADLAILFALAKEAMGTEEAERWQPRHMEQLLKNIRERKTFYNEYVRKNARDSKLKEKLAKYREWTDNGFRESLRKVLRGGPPKHRHALPSNARILRLGTLMRMRELGTFRQLDETLTKEFGTSPKKQKDAYYESYVALLVKPANGVGK